MSKLLLKALRTGFRGASAISPRLAGRMAFRLYCKPPRRKNTLTPEARELLARAEVQHVMANEHRLAVYTWRRPAETPARGSILLIHAWGSHALSMHAFVPPLLARGFDVVAYDAPAHAKANKRLTTLNDNGFAVLAAAEVAGPIHAILGHSFGGLLAAFAASGAPPLTHGLPVKRIAMISPPDSFAELTRRFGRVLRVPKEAMVKVVERIEEVTGQPIESFATSKWGAELGISILVIHDKKDREVPFKDGKAIAAATPGSRLIQTEGLGHWRIIQDASVIETAVDFLDQE